MQLRELAAPLQVLKVEGSLDREVTGITYDSRRVTPGMVFVAVRGENVDGHDYINSAIDRGASAIIYETNGFLQHKATKIKVADTREALALSSAAFYGHPSSKLKVIGITGTNGKTTVAFLVKQILEAAGIKAGLMGTVRYEIGERVIPAHRTTPEAVDLQHMMAQMVKAGCQACVMEVSSHALEQKRVMGIEFDVAIFTNLTQDHLDYHKTMDAYFAAKEKLFKSVKGAVKKSASVINIDDQFGATLAVKSQAEIQLTYGINNQAKIRAANIVLARDYSKFSVEMPSGNFSCKFPLIGRHNIYNALAAIGACAALDVPNSVMQSALTKMQPVPGRLEQVQCGQPFGVFVDYAHTDDALINVLSTLREITTGRLLLAFGCGGSRDMGKRPKMGKVAAEMADFTLITSDNPRKETPSAIASQIEEGFKSVRADGYRIELDRRKAIEEVIRQARAGDSVLIAGKGHETYQEFEDTVVPFDDRIYAVQSLETLGFARCS